MEYLQQQQEFYSNFSVYLCLLMLIIVGAYISVKFIIPTFFRLKIVRALIKNSLRIIVATTLIFALCILKLLKI